MAIVTPVIQCFQFSAKSLKLIIKVCPMTGLTGYTISILCQDDVHATISNEIQ
jgi:hypothetical protein